MSEPTKPDLINRATELGLPVTADMTKTDLAEAIDRLEREQAATPGDPVVPAVAPETAAGSQEPRSAEPKGVTFGDDEFSTQQLTERPDLLVPLVPEEVRRGVDATVVAVALRRSDPERAFWTLQDAADVLNELLMHSVE